MVILLTLILSTYSYSFGLTGNALASPTVHSVNNTSSNSADESADDTLEDLDEVSTVTEAIVQEERPFITMLVGTMHIFGIVFLVMAVGAGIAAYVAAYEDEKEATSVAKSIFSRCLIFAVFLWAMAWLIS